MTTNTKKKHSLKTFLRYFFHLSSSCLLRFSSSSSPLVLTIIFCFWLLVLSPQEKQQLPTQHMRYVEILQYYHHCGCMLYWLLFLYLVIIITLKATLTLDNIETAKMITIIVTTST